VYPVGSHAAKPRPAAGVLPHTRRDIVETTGSSIAKNDYQ
jgi:hypothetical protein